MMLRHILILTIFLPVCNIGQSQITFNCGPEIGLAFSQLPRFKTSTTIGLHDKVRRTMLPLPGPLVGFNGQLTAKNHFQFSIGIQYQMTGEYYHYHRDGTDIIHNAKYISDEWENQTYHKLCIPFTAGFTFRIYKVHPSIFIGYRPNFFFAGKYYNKNVFNHDDDARDKITERRFNPFDPEQCEILPKAFNKQFIFGLSVSTGQHLEFVITFIPGQIISYAEYAPAGFCATGSYNYFRNNDFSLSIKYKICKSTKKISTIDDKLAALNTAS